MPNITLVSTVLPVLLPQTDRTPGVHVSSTLTDMCIRLGHYDETRDNLIDQTLIQLGSTFEWALIHRYQEDDPDRYIVPAEMALDGIKGHPDLLDTYEERVKEIKFTYRSSGKVPCPVGSSPPSDHPILGPKFWKDRTQLGSYCRMVQWARGQLEICHLKGDYRRDDDGNYHFRVIHNVWEFRWSKWELVRIWDGLRRHADDYSCGLCERFEHEGHEEWCAYAT